AAAGAASGQRPPGRGARRAGHRRRAGDGRRRRAGQREASRPGRCGRRSPAMTTPTKPAAPATPATPATTPGRRPGGAPTELRGPVAGGVGASPRRPDGTLKVTGQFAYGSDLWMEDMIWGVTLRSPHPYARIRSISIGEALATGGVFAVLTHQDVPGSNRC